MPGVLGDRGFYGQLGEESALIVPPARALHAYFYDQLTRRAYVFGGSFPGYVSDLWTYNNSWTWIHGVEYAYSPGVYGEKGVGTSLTRPGARSKSSYADNYARKFYLFSGEGYVSANETYVVSAVLRGLIKRSLFSSTLSE